MEELINKYNITLEQLLILCSLEEWKPQEIKDMWYIENRLIDNDFKLK